MFRIQHSNYTSEECKVVTKTTIRIFGIPIFIYYRDILRNDN